MSRLDRAGLTRLRAELAAKREHERSVDGLIEVIVGMGTSGIASGAREAMDAVTDELREQNVTGVRVSPAGSLGMDHAEPTVEVRMAGMPDTIYGKVDPETARRIVRKHILGGTLVNDHVFDRPSVDILGETSGSGA